MRVLRGETGSEDDDPTPAARPASRASSPGDPADDRGGMASEGVLMRTLHESEWVPAAGEPEYPPHIGSGSFEPEPEWHLPALVDENGDPTGEPGYVPDNETANEGAGDDGPDPGGDGEAAPIEHSDQPPSDGGTSQDGVPAEPEPTPDDAGEGVADSSAAPDPEPLAE